jgi:hypothetical protein
MENQVLSLLDQIEAVDTKVYGSLGKAGVKRVGDIELDTERGAFSVLRSEKRALVKELSNLLEIDVMGSSGGMINVCV